LFSRADSFSQTNPQPILSERILPSPKLLASGAGFFHFLRMQSHELLREVLEKHSAKQVADDVGLSTSMIYKWAEPSAASGTANPLDRIEALIESTGDQRLVQWICQRAGGFFISNPANAPQPDYLIPATNQIVQEFADLLAVVATAAADNQINQTEAKKIRERWEELKSVTEGFVTCCEEGNFETLAKNPPPAPERPKKG
jgi:hypothetical protein